MMPVMQAVIEELVRPMDYRRRMKRLRAAMATAGQEGLLVTHLADVRYLCGFTGSNAALAIIPRRAALFTDGRYTSQAKAEVRGGRSGVRVAIRRAVVAEACQWMQRLGVPAIHYDGDRTTIAELGRMETSLEGELGRAARRRYLQVAQPYAVSGLREIKDEDELARMEAAALLGCRLFEAIVPHLQPGTPEREVAAELEFFARSLGADGMSFETIVASGVRSSLPHGQASGQPLPRKGFVTLDFGVMLNGYCSDMTRTVYMGHPSRQEAGAYEAVLEAQQAGVAAVCAGVLTGYVDAAARSVLQKARLARYFTHSTGHGVGMEIHEGPRLATKQKHRLAEGMVVTIEPGVYLPGRFGIRIEDMVAVTASGCRVLTPTSKELLRL